MKKLFSALLLGSIFACHVHGAAITNGDFSSCDYTGWQQLTDADPLDPSEFSIVNNGSTCSAEIGIDSTFASFNILYQELDLSAAVGSELTLYLDFEVDSELTGQAPFTADYFSVYLYNGVDFYDHTGALGFMYDSVDMNGPASFTQSFVLDSSFYNTSGWSLEFQVSSNFDFAPAFLTLNSVSIEESALSDDVPAPASLGLLLATFAGLSLRKRELIKASK